MVDGLDYWASRPVRFLTREEEIKAVADGDFDTLVLSVVPLVIQITERLCKRRHYPDIECALSTAFMALARSLQKYDPEQSKLTTWCYRVVYWEVLNDINDFYQQKKSHIHHRCFSQFPCGGQSPGHPTPASLPISMFAVPSGESDVDDAESIGPVVELLLSLMAPRQRQIAELRLKGHAFRDIAESLGLTRQSCEQTYIAAMKRVRAEVVKRGIKSPWNEVA